MGSVYVAVLVVFEAYGALRPPDECAAGFLFDFIQEDIPVAGSLVAPTLMAFDFPASPSAQE